MVTGLKILIVDNEDAIRRMLMILLEAEGYEVRDAADGSEGLGTDPGWRPDLILLDLMMPVVDGLEFLARRAGYGRLAEAEVIVLSADADAGLLASRRGVRAVLNKPHDLDPLLAMIEQVIQERQASGCLP